MSEKDLFRKHIINEICKKLKIQVDKNNSRDIIVFIKSLDMTILKRKYNNNKKEIGDHIIKAYLDFVQNIGHDEFVPYNIIKNNYTGAVEDVIPVNIKKIKTESKLESQLANIPINKLIDLTRILNFDSLVKTSSIYFDTRFQNVSNTNRTRFDFTLVNNTRVRSRSAVPGSGSLVSLGFIKDIVEFEIGSFYIPYNTSNINYFQELTLTFLGLKTHGYEAGDNASFHFKFNYTRPSFNTNLAYLTPVISKFKFPTPITEIDDLSIQFSNQLVPISFDIDRLRMLNASYANPGVINFSQNHNLVNNDIIIISDFTTLTPGQDDVILNQINDPNGLVITVTSPTQITIPIDLSLIVQPDTNQTPMIYFQSKRITFPLQIKYLMNADVKRDV